VKGPEFFRKTSSIFVVAIPVQGFLYFAWIYFDSRLYLFLHIPNHSNITFLWGIEVLISFIAFLPAVFFSKMHTAAKIIFSLLTVLAIPLFCFASLGFMIFEKSVENAARLGDGIYNITTYLNSHGNACYSLYRCKSGIIACESLYDRCDVQFDPTEFEVDSVKNEVHLLIGGKPVYTDGTQPRTYLDNIEMGAHKYYLAYHRVDPKTIGYMLYECGTSITTCNRIPFMYEVSGLLPARLNIDSTNTELNIIIGDELIFTYGKYPRCHVAGCSIQNK
jgi:hypothetical protein